MKPKEIYNIRFDCQKNLIYEISNKGYIVENEELLSYFTFFDNPPISTTLNITAKIILLAMDGSSTLNNVFESTFNMFDGVKRERYLFDFMVIINHMERLGIIVSKVDKVRNESVLKDKGNATQKYLNGMRKKYLS